MAISGSSGSQLSDSSRIHPPTGPGRTPVSGCHIPGAALWETAAENWAKQKGGLDKHQVALSGTPISGQLYQALEAEGFSSSTWSPLLVSLQNDLDPHLVRE